MVSGNGIEELMLRITRKMIRDIMNSLLEKLAKLKTEMIAAQEEMKTEVKAR